MVDRAEALRIRRINDVRLGKLKDKAEKKQHTSHVPQTWKTGVNRLVSNGRPTYTPVNYAYENRFLEQQFRYAYKPEKFKTQAFRIKKSESEMIDTEFWDCQLKCPSNPEKWIIDGKPDVPRKSISAGLSPLKDTAKIAISRKAAKNKTEAEKMRNLFQNID